MNRSETRVSGSLPPRTGEPSNAPACGGIGRCVGSMRQRVLQAAAQQNDYAELWISSAGGGDEGTSASTPIKNFGERTIHPFPVIILPISCTFRQSQSAAAGHTRKTFDTIRRTLCGQARPCRHRGPVGSRRGTGDNSGRPGTPCPFRPIPQ